LAAESGDKPRPVQAPPLPGVAENGQLQIQEIKVATGRSDRNALDQLLFKMHRDGLLIRPKRGVYGLAPDKIGKKERIDSDLPEE
jgi:hypothetical protein